MTRLLIVLGVALFGWGADSNSEHCGDGEVAADEMCDDGDPSNNNGCTNTCRVATCGDALVQSGVERCDDGNAIPGDGCDAECMPEH